jgi:hypothetical protein
LADRGKANLFLRLNYLTGKQGNKLKMGWKTSFYLGSKRKMQSPFFYIFKNLVNYVYRWCRTIGQKKKLEIKVNCLSRKLVIREHCKLPDLPSAVRGHTGTVLQGEPMYCGGKNSDKQSVSDCYKFVSETRNWIKVS